MKKDVIFWIVSIVFSLVIGFFSHDVLIGSTMLATSLLCSYFASNGKRINYILGIINNLIYAYVGFKSKLYGLFIFYLLIFTPLQIHGYISWGKNLDEENNVNIRGFTLKNSIIIIASCIVGSLLIGYLLTLIPGQRLAFLDSSSNIINLCGVILMILRFKEAWWVWLANNVIDLSIWTILLINGSNNAFMMFLSSLAYLLLNIYGIVKWTIAAYENKN